MLGDLKATRSIASRQSNGASWIRRAGARLITRWRARCSAWATWPGRRMHFEAALPRTTRRIHSDRRWDPIWACSRTRGFRTRCGCSARNPPPSHTSRGDCAGAPARSQVQPGARARLFGSAPSTAPRSERVISQRAERPSNCASGTDSATTASGRSALIGWAIGQGQPPEGASDHRVRAGRLERNRAQARRRTTCRCWRRPTAALATAIAHLDSGKGPRASRSIACDMWWLPALYFQQSELAGPADADALRQQALAVAGRTAAGAWSRHSGRR